MENSACRERGTKKKPESRTGIEPMTFRTPVGRSNHRATGRLMASIGKSIKVSISSLLVHAHAISKTNTRLHLTPLTIF